MKVPPNVKKAAEAADVDQEEEQQQVEAAVREGAPHPVAGQDALQVEAADQAWIRWKVPDKFRSMEGILIALYFLNYN